MSQRLFVKWILPLIISMVIALPCAFAFRVVFPSWGSSPLFAGIVAGICGGITSLIVSGRMRKR